MAHARHMHQLLTEFFPISPLPPMMTPAFPRPSSPLREDAGQMQALPRLAPRTRRYRFLLEEMKGYGQDNQDPSLPEMAVHRRLQLPRRAPFVETKSRLADVGKDRLRRLHRGALHLSLHPPSSRSDKDDHKGHVVAYRASMHGETTFPRPGPGVTRRTPGDPLPVRSRPP